MKRSIGETLFILFMGLLIGAVLGILLDRFLGKSFFSVNLLPEPVYLELYIIKLEIQLNAGSIIGLLLVSYITFKKRY
ncbi:MAG: hypothetical protein H7A25_13020 [Leptospiraceae bacterium]|nr:hypothetical protein [Leptospiraceae bacterium]MCP5500822.1 hypothetical protein [Leptospiraceae bacterium]